MRAALDGIRILDLSRLLPGPFATQIFADFGADVIKVEDPDGGDYLRGFAPLVQGESVLFLNLNRNKRSLALNLKTEEGRRVFLDLAATADVVIESFRPGVMERLGIGYETLRQGNDRLVYCALTGYGREGPHATRAGHDVNYLGMSGALDLLRDRSGRPAIPGFQMADVGGGGLNACLGILLALMARERTGAGQLVDAAMVDGLAPWLVYRWSYDTTKSAEETYLSGEFPCYAVYEASDGRFIAVGALEPKFWERLCRQLGKPEWIPLQFTAGTGRERVFEGLRAIFRSKSRDEWAKELDSADCCVTPVLEMEELAESPHWRARNLVWNLRSPDGVVTRLLGAPVRLSGTPAALRSPPPRLGEHTAEVLEGLGYSRDRIVSLRSDGVVR